MASERIKVNTVRLNTDIDRMDGCIMQLNQGMNRMRTYVGQLDKMWDGPGSEAFKKAFQDDMNALQTIISNLNKIKNYEITAKTKYKSCEKKVSGLVSGIRV